jgi:predicted kinase
MRDARQVSTLVSPNSGAIHLLIGPVGAGKTTYARERAVRLHRVFLDVDSWMVRLYGADGRPQENVIAWYLERRERCRHLMWDVAQDVLRSGTDVFLELGLVTAAERESYYARARDEGTRFVVYLFDAPRDVRRERVSRRNDSPGPFTQVVPPEFFERASDAWQAPTEAERKTWGIVEV